MTMEELETSQLEGESPSESEEDILERIEADPELLKKLLSKSKVQSEVDRRAQAAARAEVENRLKQQQEREQRRREREQQAQQSKEKENSALTLHEQLVKFVGQFDPEAEAPNLRDALYKTALKGSQVWDAYQSTQTQVTKEVNKILRQLGEKLPDEEKADLIEELTADMLGESASYMAEYLSAYERASSTRVKELEDEIKELKKELQAKEVEDVGDEIAREPSPKTLTGRKTHIYTRQEIADMDVEDYQANQKEIERQAKLGLIK